MIIKSCKTKYEETTENGSLMSTKLSHELGFYTIQEIIKKQDIS